MCEKQNYEGSKTFTRPLLLKGHFSQAVRIIRHIVIHAWCVAARCVMFEVTDPDDDRHFLCARGMTPSLQGLNHDHPHKSCDKKAN